MKMLFFLYLKKKNLEFFCLGILYISNVYYLRFNNPINNRTINNPLFYDLKYFIIHIEILIFHTYTINFRDSYN